MDTSNQMNNELRQTLYDLQEEEAWKTVEFWEQEKRVNT
jgi:predicted DNA binding CopG/RHH family protein